MRWRSRGGCGTGPGHPSSLRPPVFLRVNIFPWTKTGVTTDVTASDLGRTHGGMASRMTNVIHHASLMRRAPTRLESGRAYGQTKQGTLALAGSIGLARDPLPIRLSVVP